MKYCLVFCKNFVYIKMFRMLCIKGLVFVRDRFVNLDKVWVRFEW